MRYYRIFGGELVADSRWLRTSLDQRGAWITLAHVASSTESPGNLADRDTAELLLRREGVTEPTALLDALLRSGLVELLPDGTIAFPVGIDWTYRSPSDEPEARRERKRIERERKSHVTPGDSHEVSRAVTKEVIEQKAETDGRDARVVYEAVTGSRLSSKSRAWVTDLVSAYGHQAVISALEDEWRVQPTRRDLLQRVATRLSTPQKRSTPVLDQLADFESDPRWRAGQYGVHEIPPELVPAYRAIVGTDD